MLTSDREHALRILGRRFDRDQPVGRQRLCRVDLRDGDTIHVRGRVGQRKCRVRKQPDAARRAVVQRRVLRPTSEPCKIRAASLTCRCDIAGSTTGSATRRSTK